MPYAPYNTFPVAKKVESLYQGRIRQFTDGNGMYRDLNLPAFLDRARVDFDSCVTLEAYDVPNFERPSFKKAMENAEWRPVHKGDFFGPSWSTHWFKINVRVPTEWKSAKENPIFDFDSSDEGFVYTESGEPLQGLSGEHRRTEWPIPDKWQDGQWHTFYIETSCNDVQGNGSPQDPNRNFFLRTADLVLPHATVRALSTDVWILGDASREFPGNSWQKNVVFDLLNKIVNAWDINDVDNSSQRCRELAAEYLGDINSEKVFQRAAEQDAKRLLPQDLVWCVGNCHIDTAWLWPYAETRRKIARSWASQLQLLDKYPEYVFAASQAVQFQWLKEDYPDLFEKVKKAIKNGRFVPIGGSWVECDTNMPSGEALVRQMWLGQRFFKREFGMISRVFWLPDTFGYAPQLPQICQLASQPYFLTQKLSWNNINVFPLSTFSWVGLDRSQVLCHMPPSNTYTAEAHFGDVKRSIEQHKNLDTSQHALMLYGHGDGGGGPTAEMIEKLRRCRGIATETNLLPGTASGSKYTPEAFFETVVSHTNEGKELPSWSGELYLEYHRGTYTTQGAIKRGNRQSEILLRDIELFASAAAVKTDYEYPYDAIERLWEKTCLNQFHDVLPGSGITVIYEDARRIYGEIWEEGSKLVGEALQALGYELTDPKDPEAEYLPDFHTNHESKTFEVMARCEAKYAQVLPCTFELLDPEYVRVTRSFDDDTYHKFTLENDSFIVSFSSGTITSIFDKRQDREVLIGHGNHLKLYEDQPLAFPAWDTEQYATEKYTTVEPTSWRRHDDTAAEIAYEFGKSKMHQRIILHDEYIEFATHVDWKETYLFLKAEFPVDVVSESASYETSFGIQRRPTHYNTSWDAAKFEVCGHRFADLSDYSTGVSLLNDCKYGYSIHGQTMSLSLLRAPKSPDQIADMTEHWFRYAFMPHEGQLSPRTVQLAQFFNHPHYWVKNPKQKRPNVSNDSDSDYVEITHEFEDKSVDKKREPPHVVMVKGDSNIVVSAVALADSDASKRTGSKEVLVRVYETMGGRAHGHIDVQREIERVDFVNSLQEPIECIRAEDEEGSQVTFTLRPFQVKTFIVKLK